MASRRKRRKKPRMTKDKLNEIYVDSAESPLSMSAAYDNIGFSFTHCENGYFIHSSHKVPTGYKKPVFRVGCNKCDICRNEALQRKQLRWVRRISAMVDHYDKSGYIVQWHVVTMSPEDYVPLPAFKSQIKRMIKALHRQIARDGKGFDVKYIVTFEGSFSERNRHGAIDGDTRLHANIILFMDTNKPDAYNYVEDYCKQYWTDNNFRLHPEKGYQVSRVFSSGVGCYIAKYISKESQTTRIMSSQFGWTAFMKEYDKKWLGIKDGEKVRRWVAWDGTSLKRLRDIVNRAKAAKQPIRMSHKDALEFLRPPEKLFVVEKSIGSERFLTLDSGYRLLTGDDESIEKLKMRHNIIITPANFRWFPRRGIGDQPLLAQHYQELVHQFNYWRDHFQLDENHYRYIGNKSVDDVMTNFSDDDFRRVLNRKDR